MYKILAPCGVKGCVSHTMFSSKLSANKVEFYSLNLLRSYLEKELLFKKSSEKIKLEKASVASTVKIFQSHHLGITNSL